MREKTKISWIDYKWWFIFAVCTVFFAIRVGERILNIYSLPENLYIRSILFFLILLAYALVAFIIFLFCRRIGIIKSRAFHILSEMVLWLVLIELFVLRYLFPANISNNNFILLKSSMISLDNEKIFFEGASSLYVDVLSVVFAFLGNHEVLAYYFQFFLQILTIIILFFAVRFLVGVISAYAAAIIMALSLSFGEAVILYQPEVVYLFLWSVVLFVLALSYHAGRDIELSNKARYFSLVIIGFMTGVVLYYDFVGILLVVLAFYLLFLNQSDIVAYIYQNFFFLIGMKIGFFVMLFREAVIKSNIVMENLLAWAYRLTGDFSLSIIIPKENLPILIILSMFSIFLVVFFLQNINKGLAIFTFFIVTLCVIFPMLGFDTVNLNMWITFAWAVMAGLGLQSLMGYGFRMKVEKDVDEEDEEEFDDMIIDITEITDVTEIAGVTDITPMVAVVEMVEGDVTAHVGGDVVEEVGVVEEVDVVEELDVVEEKVPLNEDEVKLAVSVDVKVEVLDVRDEVVDAVTAEIVEEVVVEVTPDVIDVVGGDVVGGGLVIEEKPDVGVEENVIEEKSGEVIEDNVIEEKSGEVVEDTVAENAVIKDIVAENTVVEVIEDAVVEETIVEDILGDKVADRVTDIKVDDKIEKTVDEVAKEKETSEVVETPPDIDTVTKVATPEVRKEVSRYDTSTGIKYLDNPLPLPPVPVRRTMDYPYKVNNDKMFYDIEVSDDDDYDIK